MGLFTKDAEKVKKDEKRKKMAAAAKAYRVIRHENKAAEQTIGTNQDKSKSFLEGYSQVINTYIDTFGNEKQSDSNIEKLLKDYYKFYPLKRPPYPLPPLFPAPGKGKADSQKDKQDKAEQEQRKHEEAMASGEKEKPYEVQEGTRGKLNAALADTDLMQEDVTEKENEAASKGISSEAMQGLADISQWMLRNCVNTGLFHLGESQTGLVTSYILKQPARVKLFAYYLVETDKRKETGPEALKESLFTSQMDYVPNLEKFKDKMIASKFKFWKRITASEIAWDKLSQSMRFAAANIGSILPFGSMNVHEETGGGKKGGSKAPAQEGDTKQGGKKGQDAKGTGKDPKTSELELLAQEREADFNDFMTSGKELLRLKHEAEKGKSLVSRQQVLMAANRMHDAYARMDGADQQVALALEKFYESEGLKDGNVKTNNTDDNKTVSAGKYSGYAGAAVTLTGTLGRSLDKAAQGYNNFAGSVNSKLDPLSKMDNKLLRTITSWKLHKIPQKYVNDLGNLHETADILKIVGPAITLASAVLNAVDLAKHGSSMTAGAKAMRSMDIISNISGAGFSTTNAAMSLAGAGQHATDIVSGTLSAVTGGINMVTATTTLISTQVQKSDLQTASDHILIDRQNELPESERRKAENMAKLGTRLANTRQINASIKMVSGGLQLVGGILSATGVASAVGLALGTVGSILNMTTYAVSYFRKKKNIIQTIDDYINMKKMFEIVYRSLAANTSQTAKEFFKNEDKIKDQLRKEAVARLGYPSKESLYNAIIYEYATNLYNHLYYPKGDTSQDMITDETKVDKDYLLLLNGLGLKLDFKHKKPHISNIAKGFRNV